MFFPLKRAIKLLLVKINLEKPAFSLNPLSFFAKDIQRPLTWFGGLRGGAILTGNQGFY
jgi:hypothetical protein